MSPKTGSESLNSCHIHQNWVFAVVIIRLYDPKPGSKSGLLGPKRGQKFGCNTLNPKPGSDLGYGRQNGVRIGSFTLKLDLLTAFGYTAFGYMGFSVEGLLGIRAFGYTGFLVLKPSFYHGPYFGPPLWTPKMDTCKMQVMHKIVLVHLKYASVLSKNRNISVSFNLRLAPLNPS
jgi:hypothetical protein